MTPTFDDKDLEKEKPALPKELEGKTPDEITALYVKEKTEKEAAVKAAGEQDARFKDLDKKLDDLKPKTVQPKTETAKADWFSQPEKAAEEFFNAKIAPLAQTFLTVEETRQLTEVAGLKYYPKYKAEIDAALKGAAPEFRVQPGAAKAAYDYIVGKHMTEIITSEQEEAKKKLDEEPEFVETRSAAGPRRAAGIQLSADEKAAADGQGVSYEKYAKWRDHPDEAAAEAIAAGRKR